MRPITVFELKAYIEKAIKTGHGNDVVVVSDDEELNGVHGLYCEDIKDGVNKVFVDEPIEYLDEKTDKLVTANTILLY